MKIMKLSHVGKKYESDVYDNMWAIGCCPNGPDMDDNGIVFIYLNLCSLPININKIKCKWKVNILETGTIDTNQDDFDYNNYGWEWSTKRVKFTQFKRYDTFTINIEILIMKEINIDNDEVQIVTGDDVINGWRKFIEFEKSDQTERELEKYKEKCKILERNVMDLNIKYDKLRMDLYELRQIQGLVPSHKNGYNVRKNGVNRKKKVVVKRNNKVYLWLRDNVGLEEYYDLFMENGLDEMEIIQQINNETLIDIGIHKIGHRIKIIKYVSMLS